ncbi:MAG: hypothetical protein SGPRY_003770 [Prymnesium sp.]
MDRRFALFGEGEPHAVEVVNGVVHCACDRCGEWRRFLRGPCEREPPSQPVYEVITAELIAGLTSWLQLEQQKVGYSRPLRVVEVGAGSGKLTHCLRQSLVDKAETIELLATDSFARGITPVAGAEVHPLDYKTALQSLSPDIVLCCWLPLGQDWTADIRACCSVLSYVLIGEIDDGCCGRPWATWGYVAGECTARCRLIERLFSDMLHV